MPGLEQHRRSSGLAPRCIKKLFYFATFLFTNMVNRNVPRKGPQVAVGYTFAYAAICWADTALSGLKAFKMSTRPNMR